jgi:hypothetical protein
LPPVKRIEGLEETLTVQALGITGALYRTLRTTIPIENLNGSIAHFTRNVKRWKDGQMTLRWIAGALSDAKGRFRKLRGDRDMKTLLAALKSQVRRRHRCRTQGRVALRMRSRHPAAFKRLRDIAARPPSRTPSVPARRPARTHRHGLAGPAASRAGLARTTPKPCAPPLIPLFFSRAANPTLILAKTFRTKA